MPYTDCTNKISRMPSQCNPHRPGKHADIKFFDPKNSALILPRQPDSGISHVTIMGLAFLICAGSQLGNKSYPSGGKLDL